jgi:hypothetical protein
MFRRTSLSVCALAAAFGLGAFLSHEPAAVQAQPVAGPGKCVGFAAVQSLSPGMYRIYRVFEDGTVEKADDVPEKEERYRGEWRKVGK